MQKSETSSRRVSHDVKSKEGQVSPNSVRDHPLTSQTNVYVPPEQQ